MTVSLWRKIAARYRDEPAVIGFDLLNEPIAHYFETANLNPKLEPLYRKIALDRPAHIVAGVEQEACMRERVASYASRYEGLRECPALPSRK